MAAAKATIDRDEIRKWVEKRGGFPAHVKRTGEGNDPGVLRIDYPGYSGQGSLERIAWEEFFEAFDANNLAFLYQPTGKSRFSKLVDRKSVELSGSGTSILGRITSALRGRSGSSKKQAGASSSKKKSTSARKKSASSSTKRAASSKKKGSSSRKKASSSKKTTASSSKKKAASSKKSSSAKKRSSRPARSGATRTASRKSSSSKKSAGKSTRRSSASVTTTDRAEIRRWVEARGGFPAHVKRTGGRNDLGVLRIDYPGYSGRQTLERISWDDWFKAFDENRLAFLYQDKRNSRFSKLVAR